MDVAHHDWRIEPIAKKSKMNFCWLRPQQNHSLAQAYPVADWNLSGYSKVGALTTIKKISIPRFSSTYPLVISGFGDVSSLVNFKHA
jgi:hypothetical protein